MTAGRRDVGAADALGLVLIAPVAIALALLVIGLGRGVDSLAQARSAAESAAQAAALQRTPAAGRSEARRVASALLIDTIGCHAPVVEVDTTEFRPGGVVVVSVECHATSDGIEPVQMSEHRHAARAVAQIDPYRAGGNP
jgi:Flp pilus assembly protein TadG